MPSQSPSPQATARPAGDARRAPVRVAEKRLADLEGGCAAVAVVDGPSALALALLALAGPGEHVVAADCPGDAVREVLVRRLSAAGVDVTLVPADDPAAWYSALRPGTQALFGQSTGDPYGDILDVTAVAHVAHEAGVPLVVDNTLLTPHLLRPLDHGADIVVHTGTELLTGAAAHPGEGDGTPSAGGIGGFVVDGGRFDFGADPGRWPGLTLPFAAHGGPSLWDTFTGRDDAFAGLLRSLLVGGKTWAEPACDATALLRGLPALGVRVERRAATARTLAAHLEGHRQVARVHCAGLPSSPSYAVAEHALPRGAGVVVSFELAGGAAAAARFAAGLRLVGVRPGTGTARTRATLPVPDGHGRRGTRPAPGLVRLVAGEEEPADLVADLENALRAAR